MVYFLGNRIMWNWNKIKNSFGLFTQTSVTLVAGYATVASTGIGTLFTILAPYGAEQIIKLLRKYSPTFSNFRDRHYWSFILFVDVISIGTAAQIFNLSQEEFALAGMAHIYNFYTIWKNLVPQIENYLAKIPNQTAAVYGTADKKLLAEGQRMAQKAQLNDINIEIFNSNAYRAYSVFDDKRVVIYKGLINLLTEEELNGVMAHEISHLSRSKFQFFMDKISHDLSSLNLALLSAHLLLSATYFLNKENLSSIDLSRNVLGLSSIFFLFISHLCYQERKRNEEIRADQGSVILTSGNALSTALTKITNEIAKRSTVPYVISWLNSDKIFPKMINRLIDCHPTLPERDRAITMEYNKLKQESSNYRFSKHISSREVTELISNAKRYQQYR